jgi:hypothetical protein
MRVFHVQVYDDRVSGTNSVYTSAQFNDVLGQPDSFSLFVVAQQTIGSPPTLTVDFETSPDQQNWLVIENLLLAQSLNVGSVTCIQVYHTTGLPNVQNSSMASAYSRLKFTLGGTLPASLLKVWVTGRADLILSRDKWASTTEPPKPSASPI